MTSCYREVVVWRRPVKKVFLKITQNAPVPRAQACCTGEIVAQVFPYEFCKIFKNNFFCKTTPVAASGSLFMTVFSKAVENLVLIHVG